MRKRQKSQIVHHTGKSAEEKLYFYGVLPFKQLLPDEIRTGEVAFNGFERGRLRKLFMECAAAEIEALEAEQDLVKP